MGKHMNELGYVEQELAKLHNDLEKSFGVLEGLAQIQSKFEELGQTYRQLQDYAEKTQTNLEKTERLEQRLEQRFEQRCAEHESSIESRLAGIRTEIDGVRDEVDRAKGNLQQLDRLKNEVEAKMGSILQEWTGSNDDIQAPIKELDARLNHLDTRTNMARDYVQKLEKQVQLLRTGMIVAIVAAIASLGLAMFRGSGQPKTSSHPGSRSMSEVSQSLENHELLDTL